MYNRGVAGSSLTIGNDNMIQGKLSYDSWVINTLTEIVCPQINPYSFTGLSLICGLDLK